MGRNARSNIIETDATDKIVMDLNERNVQKIFKECSPNRDRIKELTKENCLESALFPRVLGYPASDYEFFTFIKEPIISNKRNILYLLGQLYVTHYSKGKPLNLSDFVKNYSNKVWTQDKGSILMLLYLGNCQKIDCISCFNHKRNDITFLADDLKPTLSPSDPNFPEWWAKHKSEWEEGK